MAQYIDKSTVLAEIEYQYNYLREHPGTYGASYILGFRQAGWQISDFINHLEMEDVALEKEIEASTRPVDAETGAKPYCKEHCRGYRETGGFCYFGWNCSKIREDKEHSEVPASEQGGRTLIFKISTGTEVGRWENWTGEVPQKGDFINYPAWKNAEWYKFRSAVRVTARGISASDPNEIILYLE